MTNAEHLIENAITCMTNGKEYEFFAMQGINREMAGNLDWYLQEVWQMADYVVNVMCQNCKKRIHWISVEDELPEIGQNDLLIVYHDAPVTEIYCAEFARTKFVSGDFSYIPGKKVTHWIPIDCLPSPEVNNF